MNTPSPTSSPTTSPTRSPLRRWALVTLALSAALVGVMTATSAQAAAPPSAQAAAAAAAAQTGWVRLAHLSPDTDAVDATLTAFGAGRSTVSLRDVSYGDVSGYQRVPAGRYAASMVPAGAPTGATPVITKTVDVTAGGAFTVAAVGRNADLTGTVLSDDLTSPAAGQAKIRLLQASVSARSVDVQATGGPTIANNAAFGSSTGYAAVPAGGWNIAVTDTTGAVPTGTSRVDLRGGTVNTLFVLDDGAGRVRVKAVTDSSGMAVAPSGGVQTGGGGLAHGATDALSAGLSSASGTGATGTSGVTATVAFGAAAIGAFVVVLLIDLLLAGSVASTRGRRSQVDTRGAV